MIFRHCRELHGTLTDVYGGNKVHRLSLVINKKGEVQTIYCQPCGPLYMEAEKQNSELAEEPIKENHYTKVGCCQYRSKRSITLL